ncbi:MAG TPA: creatininase family protein [Polyangiaceae bacterium]|jgi:creatinine amidohydrolase
MTDPRRLAELTTAEVRALVANPPTAVLVPVGSVEPHGPHLPLGTDTLLSDTAAMRACDALGAKGIRAVVAPGVAYGVTDFAEGFAGAVSVPAPVLTAMLRAIAASLLADGWSRVCFVNNHLEPAHDAAVRAAVEGLAGASVASPLRRRWASTLGEEFLSGACHAGRYETSLVLAAGGRVSDEHRTLPALGISLLEAIRAGQSRFRDIGMDRAYTGAPAEASRAEGDELYEKLVAMIVGEIAP